MRYLRQIAGVVAASAMLPFAVSAQDTTEQATAEERSPTGIEEITVTAERRESDLQDAGLSIQAFQSVDLERMSVENVQDLGAFTPGLQLNASANSNGQLNLSGRGAGNGDPNPINANTVGIYIDGVYNGTGLASMFDLLDIERIEVLKGPQGTLFGRNTIGGAVNIISKKPTSEFGAKGKIRLGEYKKRDFLGTVNIPLVGEKMLSRFSFARTLRDAYYDNDNLANGDDFDDNDDLAVRGALRFLPTDYLTMDYAFEWYQVREHNPSSALNYVGDLSSCFPGGVACPDEFGRVHIGGAILLAGNDIRPFKRSRYNPGDLNQEGEMNSNNNSWNHSYSIAWDVSENHQIKLLGGWRRYKVGNRMSLDGVPFNLLLFRENTFHRSFNTEVQFLGDLLDGRLRYVVGGIWWEEEYNTEQWSPTYTDTIFGGAFSASAKARGDSYALGYFTHLEFDITERLDFTLGLRYSAEKKKINRDNCAGGALVSQPWVGVAECPVPADGVTTFFGNRQDARFNNWSPMFRLRFHWTDEVMTYVRWSRGYRAGGFGARVANGTPDAVAPFDAENLFSWEAGIKSRWLDNRVQFNASGFYDDHEDKQISTFIPGQGIATRTDNAGKVRIRGWEMDMRVVPIQGLDVSVTHAWTKADISEFFLAPGVNDAKNRVIGQTPKRTWSGMVRYTFPPMGIGTLELIGQLVRSDKVDGFGTRIGSRIVFDNKRTIYDARISLFDAFGVEGLSLAVVGKNITDRAISGGQGIDFHPLGFGMNNQGPPRRYWVELGYEFGGI